MKFLKQYMIALIIFILKYQCREIQLWKSIGMMKLDLSSHDLTIVNGISVVNMELDLRFPQIKVSSDDSCLNSINEQFSEKIKSANVEFREQIHNEIREYVDLETIATFNKVNASNFQVPLNASEFTIEKLMNNIRICENERVQCSFTPMLSLSLGATKTELKPCYDSTIGTSSHCSQFLPNSICLF